MFNLLPYLINEIINENDKRGKSRNMNNSNNVFDGLFNTIVNNITNSNKTIDTITNNILNNSLMDSSLIKDSLKMIEYNDRYFIEGIFNEVDKSNIDMEYNNDRVTIKIKESKDFNGSYNNGSTFIKKIGYIIRSFYTPNVEESQIKATFNSNILRIVLPKKNAKSYDGVIVDVDNFTVN